MFKIDHDITLGISLHRTTKNIVITVITIGQVSARLQYFFVLNIIDYSSPKRKQHDVIDDFCHSLIFKNATST